MTRRVVIYTRSACHLCDEARAVLASMIADADDLVLDEVDIESDDRLHAAMLERIPIVELDGVVISELVPDVPAIRAALLQSPRR